MVVYYYVIVHAVEKMCTTGKSTSTSSSSINSMICHYSTFEYQITLDYFPSYFPTVGPKKRKMWMVRRPDTKYLYFTVFEKNSLILANLPKEPFNHHVLFWGVNVTTGYTLVKTRHSSLPTYLQREMDTANWSTPTFTLPFPKTGGVYPATSTFIQNCTPTFRNVP